MWRKTGSLQSMADWHGCNSKLEVGLLNPQANLFSVSFGSIGLLTGRELSTASPYFLDPEIQRDQWKILYVQTGSEKSKMAFSKLLLIKSQLVSLYMIYKRNSNEQFHIVKVQQSNGNSENTAQHYRKRKSEMATAKSEMDISQPVDAIETKF